ncbi:rho family-interacting cell polarization regulator 1-like isoform X2 [Xenia sp. Carnegie-2017]|nr:rho family-interacting cell polarization regulator 1-like isoform X2 [Xenia sp. Carnegie-2017]
MASSLSQERFNRTPRRSQSMYIAREGLDEPDILKRRAHSTRAGRKRRRSSLFTGKSMPKIPQIENTVNMFERVIKALRDCAENVKDRINKSPVTARRALEQKLRWCEERLDQVDGLCEFYQHEIKMRQGARNLETALQSYGVKHGHDKCKSNYRESTQNMCEIEEEFERRIGRFKVHVDALDGFARLCPGDNFEVFVRNAIGRKWKAKCKIERDGQKWTENHIEVKGSLKDTLFLRIFEIKKIQSNTQLGSFSLRLRNYIASCPISLSIPVNKSGNLKLRVTFHWQPLSTKEESKLKKSNRDYPLSDVYFGSVLNVSHSPEISFNVPDKDKPSSPSADPESIVLGYESTKYMDRLESLTQSLSEESDSRTFLDSSSSKDDVVTSDDSDEAKVSPTFDKIIRRLFAVLEKHLAQHPQLQGLYEKLEKLDEILQVGKLGKTNFSGSVESALDSFSFLDLTDVGTKLGDDVRASDTGYFSSTNDDLPKPLTSPEVNHSMYIKTTRSHLDDALGTDKNEDSKSQSFLSSYDNVAEGEPDACSYNFDLASTGITIIDKVLLQHLEFCLQLTKDFGSVGPLKCKETSAVIKLEWQCGILHKLIQLANDGTTPHTISQAYPPLAASGHDEMLLFWAGHCGNNPLFMEYEQFIQALRDQFTASIDERFHSVLDTVYPVICVRVLQENDSLMTPIIPPRSVVSIYQFTDYFLIDNRWNLIQFVESIAKEVLTYGHLISDKKSVVLTQLQMYNKIPFEKSCCVCTSRLLVDPDSALSAAAGVYFEALLKDEKKRAQAISYCIEALEDNEEDLRIAVCHALKKLQGKEAIEHLSFLVKCDTDRVKKASQIALASLGNSEESDVSSKVKNGDIWNQTIAMSDLSKSSEF